MKTLSLISMILFYFQFSAQVSTASDSSVLNDAWYTMQAGSTPWGYFHEVIEKKNSKYAYRYEMVKMENGKEYVENLGAIADQDLRPVTFNISKTGEVGTEIVNGVYQKKDKAGTFMVDIKGGRVANLQRSVGPETILEVFFPVWLVNQKGKMTTGSRGQVKVFTEDPTTNDYRARAVRYSIKGLSTKDKCVEVNVEMESLESLWCINEKGGLVRMSLNNNQIQVTKVANEKAAKAFLAKVKESKEK